MGMKYSTVPERAELTGKARIIKFQETEHNKKYDKG
jgi:hypothetical protein